MIWKPLALAAAMAALLFLLFASSCSQPDQESRLWVFAAASLTDVLEDLATDFEAANHGVEVGFQFAGSSQLATQIRAGAPADVFASANETVMTALLDDLTNQNGRDDQNAANQLGDPQVFVSNQLVIAVPAGNPLAISGLADLTSQPLVLAVCDLAVPCGMLADEAAAQAGVQLSPSTYEANVRSVLAKLVLQEVDAGLVYRSDLAAYARQSAGEPTSQPQLEAIAIVPAPTANYPVTANRSNPTAGKFVEFLQSAPAQAKLADYGFGAAQPSQPDH